MGTTAALSTEPRDLSRFMCHLINDIKAVDRMLAEKHFETAPIRIGAEQELCLVDSSWRPAPLSLEVLEGIDDPHFTTEHRTRYLGIVEERVKTGRTGSQWVLDSHQKLIDGNDNYEANVAITAASHKRRVSGKPVHQWQAVHIEEAGDWINRYWKVEQIMTTDFFSVRLTDPIYFAANVLTWKHLRYAPVEDADGHLVGLLTQSRLLELFSESQDGEAAEKTAADAMIANPLTVRPSTLSIDALSLMRERHIGCLPVVSDGELVGLLTEVNFMNFSELTISKLVDESARRLKGETELPSVNTAHKPEH